MSVFEKITKKTIYTKFYVLILISIIYLANVKSQSNTQEQDTNEKKLEITNLEELKVFVIQLLSKEMDQNYNDLDKAEKLFFDKFIDRIVVSYNYSDYAFENIKKHINPENIELQKDLALKDYMIEYEMREDELNKENKKSRHELNEFSDDDLNKEYENKIDL